MTLLTGVLISFTTSLLKWLSEKIGQTMTKNLVLVILFVVAYAYTALEQAGFISKEIITQALQILGVAMLWYEVVVKKFINPLFESLDWL